MELLMAGFALAVYTLMARFTFGLLAWRDHPEPDVWFYSAGEARYDDKELRACRKFRMFLACIWPVTLSVWLVVGTVEGFGKCIGGRIESKSERAHALYKAEEALKTAEADQRLAQHRASKAEAELERCCADTEGELWRAARKTRLETGIAALEAGPNLVYGKIWKP